MSTTTNLFEKYLSEKCDDAPIQEKLKLLFKYWEEKQIEEPDSEYEKTCPKKLEEIVEFKKSFIPDGCVDYDLYEKANTKLLFILKEPGRIDRKNPSNFYIGENDDASFENHWYKKTINKDNTSEKYRVRFERMASVFNVDIKSTAMLNINKRGGFCNGTNATKLKNYAKAYKEFIIEQIKILNPDIIVSCIGAGTYYELFTDGKWVEITVDNKKCYGHFGGRIAGLDTMKSYNTYHPSNTRIRSVEKYGQLLEEIVKNAE